MLESCILPGSEKIDLRDVKAVATRLQCPLSAKQYGYEQMLAPLIAEACISVCPKNPLNFNVDNVRTVKMPGAPLRQTAALCARREAGSRDVALHSSN